MINWPLQINVHGKKARRKTKTSFELKSKNTFELLRVKVLFEEKKNIYKAVYFRKILEANILFAIMETGHFLVAFQCLLLLIDEIKCDSD